MKVILLLLIGFVGSGHATEIESETNAQSELIGIAWLEADTFRQGAVSGRYLELANEDFPSNPLPHATGQPVQGFSAVIDQGDGSFLVLADNGYGSKANSADFVLVLYRIRPDFKTANGGSGAMGLESIIELSDPNGHAPFKRIAEHQSFPEGGISFPIDPVVREYSLLTGADFDPESLQRMDDGSFWIGDEFGPWLLHFDPVGRLTRPPVPLPGIRSPDNEQDTDRPVRAVRSGGLESMTQDKDTGILYLMLEKPLSDGDRVLPRVLPVFAFDPGKGKFLPETHPAPVMHYPLEEGARGVGAFLSLGKGVFLALERDRRQGVEAQIKRIYRVDKTRLDSKGALQKELLVDLLAIHDPQGLASGMFQTEAGHLRFSFETIESLVRLGPDTLGVLNDNNYPFGTGPNGHAESDVAKTPEGTFFIVLKVPALMSSDWP